MVSKLVPKQSLKSKIVSRRFTRHHSHRTHLLRLYLEDLASVVRGPGWDAGDGHVGVEATVRIVDHHLIEEAGANLGVLGDAERVGPVAEGRRVVVDIQDRDLASEGHGVWVRTVDALVCKQTGSVASACSVQMLETMAKNLGLLTRGFYRILAKQRIYVKEHGVVVTLLCQNPGALQIVPQRITCDTDDDLEEVLSLTVERLA